MEQVKIQCTCRLQRMEYMEQVKIQCRCRLQRREYMEQVKISVCMRFNSGKGYKTRNRIVLFILLNFFYILECLHIEKEC